MFSPASIWANDRLPVAHDAAQTGTEIISEGNIRLLQNLWTLGNGAAREAQWSADGKWLAVASTQGVWLYATNALEEAPMLVDDSVLEAKHLSFSGDSQKLAFALSNGEIHVWDVAAQALVYSFQENRVVAALAFSGDGRRLAAGDSFNAKLFLWDVETGQQLIQTQYHTSAIQTLAFSPDSSSLAVGSLDGTVSLWDAATGDNILHDNQNGPILRIVFSREGHLWTATSSDSRVQVWSVADKARRVTLQDGRAPVYDADFSPNGKQIVTAADDGKVRLWDVETGTLIYAIEAHDSTAHEVAFSPDGTLIASGQVRGWSEDSAAGNVRLWKAETGELSADLDAPLWSVNTLSFSPDGSQLLAVSEDGILQLWDVASQNRVELEGYWGWVNAVMFDRHRLIVGGADGTIRIYDLHQLDAAPQVLRGHRDWVWGLALSPDQSRLVSAGKDNRILVWDMESQSSLFSLEGHTDWVNSVTFSADGTLIYSASDDGTVRTWGVASGKSVATLPVVGGINDVAFSADGVSLAGAGANNIIWLWDTSAGTNALPLSGHTRSVNTLIFNAKGNILFTGSSDNSVRIWNAGENSIHVLQGHINPVLSLAVSPDGQLLVSGSADGTMRVWKVNNGNFLLSYAAQHGIVRDLAFSQDGRFIASAGPDGVVRVSGIPYQD